MGPMKNSRDDHSRGQTVPVQGEQQERVPRAPHERDESADSQARAEPSQRRIGSVAHDSVERGQVDTDKGPVLDRAYDKLKRR
jgi:hypothetical protein